MVNSTANTRAMVDFPRERRREGQDPNNERARVRQKTDIIITGPAGAVITD